MTAAIRRAGVTNTIVRINVSRTGKATLIGRIPRGTRNPLVEVNFADNRLSGTSGSYVNAYYTTGARYVRNAINAVTKRYGYRNHQCGIGTQWGTWNTTLNLVVTTMLQQ